MPASTALLTDHYELTMLQAALSDGTAARRSVFELFARRLPPGRRYGVVAGTGRVLDALEQFRFGAAEVAWLRDHEIVDDATCDWLAEYRFDGDVWGYPEGEMYFPSSPVLVVEGTFAETVLLETLMLSVLNHDSAVASAASRMVSAAADRPCIEMGSRRTQEWSAVAAARSAYIAGFATTSNLEAGRTHGIPTAGTSAHSFTLVHDTERDAFTSQVESLGAGTTLLVDTYDIAEAVRVAVEVAGPSLGAVTHRLRRPRLLGPPGTSPARRPRRHGHPHRRHQRPRRARHRLARGRAGRRLRGRHGPGHRFRRSHQRFRLQARGARGRFRHPRPGRQEEQGEALRGRTQVRTAAALCVRAGRGGGHRHRGAPVNDGDDRSLLVPLVESGRRVHHDTLDDARARHRSALDELPDAARKLSRGEPVIETVFE